MIRPWFRQAAVPWKTTATQTRASGENRVSTKPGVLQVDEVLAGAGGGDQGGGADVVDGSGLAAGGLVDLGDGLVGEEVPRTPVAGLPM